MMSHCSRGGAPAAIQARNSSVAQTRRRLGEFLERLTENQRTVLVLKIQEGRSYREISDITGLSVSNVGFLIHRGLKKMAQLIGKEERI